MLLKRFPSFLTLSLLAAALMAQSGGIRGPVSGLVYDGATRSVRPVVGVPGASYLGGALLSGVDFASAAPDGSSVIALAGGRLYLVRDAAGAPRWSVLEENSSADQAAWSDDSAAAAVYSSATGRVRLFSELNDVAAASITRLSPRSGRSNTVRPGVEGLPQISELGQAPGNEVLAMAVDTRGDVLVGVEDGVYLGSGGSFKLLASIGKPGGIAIDGDRLFVAGRARSEVVEIRNYRAAADVVMFASAERGIADPVALAVASGQRSLIVASAGERKLVWFDISSGAEQARLDLDFEPSRLEARNSGSMYLLNTRSAAGETLHVLAGERNPAVYFVPAGSAAATSRTSSVEE